MTDKAKTALLFSGQGSQYVGMIKSLYDEFEQARDMVNSADEALGFKLSEICFGGPVERLKQTRYTQPAIYLHSAVAFSLLGDKLTYNATAGHSVGEYAALYASGVIEFIDGLKLVAKRGELMFSTGEQAPGTMFAIIGLEEDKVDEVCTRLNDNTDGNVVVPANYNSPGQIVISGSKQFLVDNADEFKKAGAKMVKELVVSGAFHSPLMLPAKEALAEEINYIDFRDAHTPVYSNVYAKPLIKAAEIKEALIAQLTSPVKWTQTLENMKSGGINQYIEIGPGTVLQGLVKRTLLEIEFSGIDKAEDIKNYS